MKSIVKRCSVAAVLALAALMPDFRLLNTSPEGLASLANSDVDALIKVLPRMTYPALTEHEIARLDASDLMQFAAEVIGFLSPSSAR
ncbi:hypothetical protein [Enterobacter hormaechei]|uniref:hypothetical protein n=1 Tax=Enterobacter hormaechei TaxID=158836 RepID=UPI00223B59C3|nr:hypothetical protein [Enterobacter hormaechei]